MEIPNSARTRPLFILETPKCFVFFAKGSIFANIFVLVRRVLLILKVVFSASSFGWSTKAVQNRQKFLS